MKFIKYALIAALLGHLALPAMEAPGVPEAAPIKYNVPSLRFLAARRVAQGKTEEEINALKMATELKNLLQLFIPPADYERLLRGPIRVADVFLNRAVHRNVLDESLLQDLCALDPTVALDYSLHIAAFYGHVVAARALLHHGVNPNSAKALESMASINHMEMEPRHILAMKLLLQNGADVNMGTALGENVLQLFVGRICKNVFREFPAEIDINRELSSSAISFIKILLENNINIDNQDISGKTVLMDLVSRVFDATILMKMILTYKPNLELMDSNGETAFTLAVETRNIPAIELLKKAGANINH